MVKLPIKTRLTIHFTNTAKCTEFISIFQIPCIRFEIIYVRENYKGTDIGLAPCFLYGMLFLNGNNTLVQLKQIFHNEMKQNGYTAIVEGSSTK